MANMIKNFLGYFKLDEEEDDYEDYMDEMDDKERSRMERERIRELERAQKKDSFSERKLNRRPKEVDVPDFAESRRDKSLRADRTSNNKIVPIRTTAKGLEVCIMKPSTFEDSQEICDMLLTGRAVVVNLEGFDPDVAQRIMDFISGAVYAIGGKLHQISRYIFIFSPDNIDISGDYLDLVPVDGLGVPTINKEF
ncbi:cell division protein SepF [[Clostridium] polysaccharolyticum]|uniref:Cell division protein SepF n=1 Tax=[Clostridium] polysaccharolyticum TaxID=29364 RepID=A0A1I0E3K7_9FIRM|nr:cell division protein SepF [[Clostridium] polysaccharolyticum]SET38913.1 cell division inhibitor SepF [[Clostridium] polysaccharolyticum]